MDSNVQSSPSESGSAKAAFRKPSNDAGNRKYRRRSPVSGSNSSGGSPNREHGSSPSPSREERVEISDDRRRRDDGRYLDRDLARSKYGRSSDSYRQSDRQSNRRHDYSRRDKFTDEDDRKYPKLSSRSERESRGGTRSDYRRQESEYNRGRDPFRDVDKYSRDRFDGSGHRNRDKDRETSSLEYKKYKDKDSSYERAGSGTRQTSGGGRERDMQKGSGDGRDGKRDYWDTKNDSSPSYEESRGHRNDSASRRDTFGHRLKESSRSNPKEFDDQKYSKEEKYKYDDRDTDRHKERHNREPGEQLDNRITSSSENRESSAKKPKLFSLDKSMDHGNDADEKQSSTSKQPQEFAGKATSEQDYVKDSDIDAAKVAALKAAELVHKNLVGTTFMSADQKKKLLWGNKKNIAEESAPRWDTSLFSDRERQEKFNKLMSLRLPWYLWPIVGCEGRHKSGAQARESRWWRPPTSREAEGTPAGFGEAIHGWTPSKRWSHSWTRSLRIYFYCHCTSQISFSCILLYYRARNLFLAILSCSLLQDMFSHFEFSTDKKEFCWRW